MIHFSSIGCIIYFLFIFLGFIHPSYALVEPKTVYKFSFESIIPRFGSFSIDQYPTGFSVSGYLELFGYSYYEYCTEYGYMFLHELDSGEIPFLICPNSNSGETFLKGYKQFYSEFLSNRHVVWPADTVNSLALDLVNAIYDIWGSGYYFQTKLNHCSAPISSFEAEDKTVRGVTFIFPSCVEEIQERDKAELSPLEVIESFFLHTIKDLLKLSKQGWFDTNAESARLLKITNRAFESLPFNEHTALKWLSYPSLLLSTLGLEYKKLPFKLSRVYQTDPFYINTNTPLDLLLDQAFKSQTLQEGYTSDEQYFGFKLSESPECREIFVPYSGYLANEYLTMINRDIAKNISLLSPATHLSPDLVFPLVRCQKAIDKDYKILIRSYKVKNGIMHDHFTRFIKKSNLAFASKHTDDYDVEFFFKRFLSEYVTNFGRFKYKDITESQLLAVLESALGDEELVNCQLHDKCDGYIDYNLDLLNSLSCKSSFTHLNGTVKIIDRDILELCKLMLFKDGSSVGVRINVDHKDLSTVKEKLSTMSSVQELNLNKSLNSVYYFIDYKYLNGTALHTKIYNESIFKKMAIEYSILFSDLSEFSYLIPRKSSFGYQIIASSFSSNFGHIDDFDGAASSLNIFKTHTKGEILFSQLLVLFFDNFLTSKEYTLPFNEIASCLSVLDLHYPREAFTIENIFLSIDHKAGPLGNVFEILYDVFISISLSGHSSITEIGTLIPELVTESQLKTIFKLYKISKRIGHPIYLAPKDNSIISIYSTGKFLVKLSQDHFDKDHVFSYLLFYLHLHLEKFELVYVAHQNKLVFGKYYEKVHSHVSGLSISPKERISMQKDIIARQYSPALYLLSEVVYHIIGCNHVEFNRNVIINHLSDLYHISNENISVDDLFVVILNLRASLKPVREIERSLQSLFSLYVKQYPNNLSTIETKGAILQVPFTHNTFLLNNLANIITALDESNIEFYKLKSKQKLVHRYFISPKNLESKYPKDKIHSDVLHYLTVSKSLYKLDSFTMISSTNEMVGLENNADILKLSNIESLYWLFALDVDNIGTLGLKDYNLIVLQNVGRLIFKNSLFSFVFEDIESVKKLITKTNPYFDFTLEYDISQSLNSENELNSMMSIVKSWINMNTLPYAKDYVKVAYVYINSFSDFGKVESSINIFNSKFNNPVLRLSPIPELYMNRLVIPVYASSQSEFNKTKPVFKNLNNLNWITNHSSKKDILKDLLLFGNYLSHGIDAGFIPQFCPDSLLTIHLIDRPIENMDLEFTCRESPSLKIELNVDSLIETFSTFLSKNHKLEDEDNDKKVVIEHNMNNPNLDKIKGKYMFFNVGTILKYSGRHYSKIKVDDYLQKLIIDMKLDKNNFKILDYFSYDHIMKSIDSLSQETEDKEDIIIIMMERLLNDAFDYCSICIEPMQISSQMKFKPTPCGHALHLECYNQLIKFKSRTKCPTCRTKLTQT